MNRIAEAKKCAKELKKYSKCIDQNIFFDIALARLGRLQAAMTDEENAKFERWLRNN